MKKIYSNYYNTKTKAKICTLPGIIFVIVVTGCIGVMWWSWHAMLGWGGGSWHVLGQGGGESAGGRVLHTMLGWRGGQWRLGLACHVEAAWRGLAQHGVMWQGLGMCWVGVAWQLGLACCVEAAWQGLSMPCWVSEVGWQWWGRMEVAHMHEWPTISRVLRAVLGWQGGLAVAGCQGRMEVAHMHEWPAISWLKVLCAVLGQQGVMAGWRWLVCMNGLQHAGFACHVGVAWQVGGGSMLGWGQMEVAHVHKGTAMACNVKATGIVHVK
ncbi:hypothetical protein EDB86DRAFT_2824918 [Lactarius hatsudake]|nr:hypothetical protein EDB86DRAFT_2824918 [Lactarius hatsudake]